MPWYERHYNRDEQDGYAGRGPRLGAGGGWPHSVTLWLLVVTVAVSLLDGILSGSMRASALSPSDWGYFSFERAVRGLELWRWISFQFLHNGLLHLLFNMIGLYFFGPVVEARLGGRRFLAFYLLCGMAAAALASLLALAAPGLLYDLRMLRGVPPTAIGLVGASGGVFGILVACAVTAPRMQVRLLFPPIPMTMRTLALVFLGIAVFSVLVGSANAGGEAAHLGGAAAGFLLIRFPRALAFAQWGSTGWISQWRWRRQQHQAQRQKQRRAQEDAEVDRILAKVKDHGLHSLSNREKRTLTAATNRQRQDR